jgi:hypothetical protein
MHGGFRVNASIKHKIEQRKCRILRRLDKTDNRGCGQPMMTASNIHYEIADRMRATAAGGIGGDPLDGAEAGPRPVDQSPRDVLIQRRLTTGTKEKRTPRSSGKRSTEIGHVPSIRWRNDVVH